MSFLLNQFSTSPRAGAAWFCVGSASSYPEVGDTERVGAQRKCLDKYTPGCRIFYIPRGDSSAAVEVAIDDWKDLDHGDSKDQVMVFKYNGKFVAINHVRLVQNTILSCALPTEVHSDIDRMISYCLHAYNSLAAGVSAFILPSIEWNAFRY
jgi:hypothetical protein